MLMHRGSTYASLPQDKEDLDSIAPHAENRFLIFKDSPYISYAYFSYHPRDIAS
ncbi:hypothetical protein MACH08_39160 [Oceanobacillus kimchii]|uniref:Uncharacterized protein n=1 Tax=Oceanobacillus kimchii TaxID=746691 RepID=A0ABQ5TPL5_9BACI|nr:hypothetical protein MACH08_39160 [Oceanobacillus kimchii]